MDEYKALTKKNITQVLKGDRVFKNCIIEKINFLYMPSLNNAVFENCLFIRCKFDKTTFSNIKWLNTEFNLCSFTDTEMSEIHFIKCTYINCDFSLSTIFNVKFSLCRFCASYFYSCILKNIVYRNCEFYNTIKFDESYLSHNKFVNCRLKSGNTSFLNVKYDSNEFKNSNIEPIFHIDEKAIILMTKYKKSKNGNES